MKVTMQMLFYQHLSQTIGCGELILIMYTHMVNHYIITFKVRGQGHNANVLHVLNLTKSDCRLSYSNIIEDCKQWNHGL